MTSADRRTDTRAFVSLAVGISAEAGAEELSVSSLNVSAGGVYVQVPHFIEPLTKLALALDIPGPTPKDSPVRIETEAIVVRTSPESADADTEAWEIACAFLDLKDEHRDAINRYVLTHRVETNA